MFLVAYLGSLLLAASVVAGPAPPAYPDGRPVASLRMEAKDAGVLLKHGDGPIQCDILGAREALIFKEKGIYHLFYDGAGPKGWLACLATSKDLKTWTKKGAHSGFRQTRRVGFRHRSISVGDFRWQAMAHVLRGVSKRDSPAGQCPQLSVFNDEGA